MAKHQYRYDVDYWSHGVGSYEDAFVFDADSEYDLTDEWDRQALIECCAEDYYHNHDGWEHKEWQQGGSITFAIWTTKDSYKEYTVEVEFNPSFMAYEK